MPSIERLLAHYREVIGSNVSVIERFPTNPIQRRAVSLDLQLVGKGMNGAGWEFTEYLVTHFVYGERWRKGGVVKGQGIITFSY